MSRSQSACQCPDRVTKCHWWCYDAMMMAVLGLKGNDDVLSAKKRIRQEKKSFSVSIEYELSCKLFAHKETESGISMWWDVLFLDKERKVVAFVDRLRSQIKICDRERNSLFVKDTKGRNIHKVVKGRLAVKASRETGSRSFTPQNLQYKVMRSDLVGENRETDGSGERTCNRRQAGRKRDLTSRLRKLRSWSFSLSNQCRKTCSSQGRERPERDFRRDSCTILVSILKDLSLSHRLSFTRLHSFQDFSLPFEEEKKTTENRPTPKRS